MKNAQKIFHKTIVAALIAALATPSYAALGLLNTPPSAVIPPIPNVVVTLDDSGSMGGAVDYDSSIDYVIPPNANGLQRGNGGGSGKAYNNGYADPQPTNGDIDLSSGKKNDGNDAFRTAYKALTSAQQQQNYINWFSYYRTRNLAMKASVMRSFAPQVVPDGRMRIAWHQLTQNCASFTNTTGCTNNRLKSFEGSQRTNFFDWIRGVPASSNTPLRATHKRVGEYMKTTGVNGAYAFDPGTTEAPVLSCRRSYHVLFTDGGWNDTAAQWPAAGAGNQDNTTATLPDGTDYTVTPPYRGRTGAAGTDTLSDVAFNYWATDLQPTLTNDVRRVIKKSGPGTYGTTTIGEYWNPKNDPATWQHLTLYAVGFGEAAELAPDASNGLDPAVWPTFATDAATGAPLGTTDGTDFAQIVAGTRNWPDAPGVGVDFRAWDLWHAAVNTRGDMFPAKTPDQVINAFQKIVSEILAANASTGGASSSLSFTNDFLAISGGYEAGPWRGILKGYSQSNNKVDLANPVFDAQKAIGLQTPGSRTVLTASNPTTGAAFRWSNLSTYQQSMLNRNYSYLVDGNGEKRVDYLRGSAANEPTGPAIPSPSFRSRQGFILGTIVNSEPRLIGRPRSGFDDASYKAFRDLYATRPKITYVGANDGMLHGVDGTTGQAVLSYVPRGVFGRLSEYTDGSYQHKYFVDGPIIPGDAYVDGNWRTFLIGGLGAGGRGLFGLDITNPTNFSESNASSIVKFDYTAPSEALPTGSPNAASAFTAENGSAGLAAEVSSDLGHIMGDGVRDPLSGRSLQVAKLRNNRWAFITGNGINSVSEKAALYVINLDAAGGYQKIVADNTAGANNGLSTPLPVDTDGDDRVDVIYAGDLKGNLWKFSSDAAGTFTLANGGAPLINVGKPITSAPAVALHPRGGLVVTFGTGRLYTVPDKTSTDTQTLYGVWDKPGTTGTVTLSDLVTRTLSGTSENTVGGGPNQVRTLTRGAIDYNTKRGWKIDLSVSGERNIFNPFTDGRVALYSTYVPKEGQTCLEGSEGGSLLAFDVINGSPTAGAYFDFNSDGNFDNQDLAASSPTENNVGGWARGVGKMAGIIKSGLGTSSGGGGGGGTPNCIPWGARGSGPGMRCLGGPGRVGWRDLTP